MDSEELLLDQAKRRKAAICPASCAYPAGCPDKAACPQAKTWVYRNFVKALPWYTSVREKLTNPAYAGFFLKFNPSNSTPYAVPPCDSNYSPPKCSPFYHDQEQTPGHPKGDGDCGAEPCDCGAVPCGEYLFDHRNGSMLQQWLVDEYAGGAATGLANPNIDGFFIDDGWGSGPSEEDAHSVRDMGLDKAEVAKIRAGWAANMAAVKAKILQSGGFNWQMFDVNGGTAAAAPFQKEQCTAYMRGTACKPSSPLQTKSLFYGYTDYQKDGQKGVLPYFEQDLAAFMLIRGPYAWLGYSWMGCNNDPNDKSTATIKYHFPEALGKDYGEPLGLCSETAPGSEVFHRAYSKANVTLNCKNWIGSITPV